MSSLAATARARLKGMIAVKDKLNANENTQEFKEPLTEPLRRLETALDTPPVSGELRTWAATMRKTFAETAHEILEQIEHVHPEQFDEIAQQNSELLRESADSAKRTTRTGTGAVRWRASLSSWRPARSAQAPMRSRPWISSKSCSKRGCNS